MLSTGIGSITLFRGRCDLCGSMRKNYHIFVVHNIKRLYSAVLCYVVFNYVCIYCTSPFTDSARSERKCLSELIFLITIPEMLVDKDDEQKCCMSRRTTKAYCLYGEKAQRRQAVFMPLDLSTVILLLHQLNLAVKYSA